MRENRKIVERLFSYNKSINPKFSVFKDSIPCPSSVREIIEIVAYVDNGENQNCYGFLSIFNEKTKEQLLNGAYVNNDKRHYNKKRIQVHHVPRGNNLDFVLNTAGLRTDEACHLVILLKYIE